MKTTTDAPVVWHGCYDERWTGLIVPEAFSHPAKMARGLVVRIFAELVERGWLRPGDTVLDPFGGIGSTGIEGASAGMRVVCVELEPKFVALAEQNFAKHRDAWVACGRPLPQIVQGDSRKLREALAGAAVSGVVSSPPYEGSLQRASTSAGPNGGSRQQNGVTQPGQTYGAADGQLGSLEPGDVDAVIASPPFLDARSETTASIKGSTPTAHDPEAMGNEDGNLCRWSRSLTARRCGRLRRIERGS